MAADRFGFPTKQSALAGRIDPDTIVAASAQNKPLHGKKITLLGPLRGLSLRDSQRLIHDLGGHCDEHICADTNFVVACGMTLEEAGHFVCNALAINTPDNPEAPPDSGIRVLSERQFRALLPGGKAPAWR